MTDLVQGTEKIEDQAETVAQVAETDAKAEAAHVERESDSYWTTPETDARTEFDKIVAKEEAIVAGAQKIEHIVVQQVETAVHDVEIAAENVARPIINFHLKAGGGSIIRNPG